MFILKCLLQTHVDARFYPALDVLQLHHILTMKQEELLLAITPSLRPTGAGAGGKETNAKMPPKHQPLTGDKYQKKMKQLR